MDDKIHLIFTVYDSDGDGIVSADDMELMLRQLAGSTLRSASAYTILRLHINSNSSCSAEQEVEFVIALFSFAKFVSEVLGSASNGNRL